MVTPETVRLLRMAFERFEKTAYPPATERVHADGRMAAVSHPNTYISSLASMLCGAFLVSEQRSDNAAAALANTASGELLSLSSNLIGAREEVRRMDLQLARSELAVRELAQHGMIIANIAFEYEAENTRLRDMLRETGVDIGHEQDGDEGAMYDRPEPLPGGPIEKGAPWAKPEVTELDATDQRVTEATFGEPDGGLVQEQAYDAEPVVQDKAPSDDKRFRVKPPRHNKAQGPLNE